MIDKNLWTRFYELYNYFNSRSEKVIMPYAEKEELFIKRYSNNELEN